MSIDRVFSISLLISLALLLQAGGALSEARPGSLARPDLVPGTGASSDNVDLLGRWASGPCRDVTVIGGTAYIVDGGRLEILNVSLPNSPVVIGKISLPSMPIGVTVFGIHAYVADGGDGLRVIGISDPGGTHRVGSFRGNGRT